MQSTQVRRCCGPNPFYRECLLRTKLCNQLVDAALEPLHLGRIAPTLPSLPPRLPFSLPGLLLVLMLLLRPFLSFLAHHVSLLVCPPSTLPSPTSLTVRFSIEWRRYGEAALA